MRILSLLPLVATLALPAALLATACLALVPGARAQSGGAAFEAPMLDPWVPPEVREKATALGLRTSTQSESKVFLTYS